MWLHFWSILEYGSDLPRERRDEDLGQLALEAALIRGHHKSAKKDEGGLKDLLIDDVTSGYNVPLLLDQVRSIPSNGNYHQNTFNEDNLIVKMPSLQACKLPSHCSLRIRMHPALFQSLCFLRQTIR
jgi:hypothetical protein